MIDSEEKECRKRLWYKLMGKFKNKKLNAIGMRKEIIDIRESFKKFWSLDYLDVDKNSNDLIDGIIIMTFIKKFDKLFK